MGSPLAQFLGRYGDLKVDPRLTKCESEMLPSVMNSAVRVARTRITLDIFIGASILTAA